MEIKKNFVENKMIINLVEQKKDKNKDEKKREIMQQLLERL